MINVPKPWWLSKTILAALAILIVSIFGRFGVTLANSDAEALVEAVRSVVTGVFAMIAIWGRVTAEQKIG